MAGNEQKSDDAGVALASLLGAGPLGRVLDIGCGTGTILRTVAGRASELTGIEPSEPFLATARTRVPEATFLAASIEERTPFDDGSFDTIFFCDVIEHLRKPVDAFEEITRLLSARGSLLVTTPNASSPMRLVRGASWFGVSDPTHLLLFTPFTLAHLMRAAGLEIERVTTMGLTGNGLVDRALETARGGGTLAIVARRARAH